MTMIIALCDMIFGINFANNTNGNIIQRIINYILLLHLEDDNAIIIHTIFRII